MTWLFYTALAPPLVTNLYLSPQRFHFIGDVNTVGTNPSLFRLLSPGRTATATFSFEYMRILVHFIELEIASLYSIESVKILHATLPDQTSRIHSAEMMQFQTVRTAIEVINVK